jgi:sugar phosphate isomerase/epimerase
MNQQHDKHLSSRRHFLQRTGAISLGMMSAQFAVAFEPAAATAAQASSGGKALKLGLASYSLRALDLDHVLEMTQRVGLKHLCLKSVHLPLDAKPDQITTIVEKVRQANLDFYGVGVITMHKQTDVDRAFEYAKTAGVKVIVAAPSAEMLPHIEEKVKQYDLAVAIHNHGPGDKHFPTPESVYSKIRDLDRRIGLCIDIGHTVRGGADLLASVEKYGDRLLDMHMKDVTEATAKGKEVQVGRGVIDMAGLLRALVKRKYQGVVSFEYEPEPKDPLPGLAESVGYVRGVLAAL